jgi:hypothetical protein
MDTGLWLIILAVVVVLAIIVAVAVVSRRRRQHLQERFGPEYDRIVQDAESRRDAERELQERERHRDELEIRPLSSEERARYVERWEAMQGTFVDAPAVAVRDADLLLQEVMRTRGYPVEDFEERASTISVDHPEVVENYREAHAVAARQDFDDVSTEELRRALLHYRRLFEELTTPASRERHDDGQRSEA